MSKQVWQSSDKLYGHWSTYTHTNIFAYGSVFCKVSIWLQTNAVYACLQAAFWPTNAKALFIQAETQFTIHGIRQDATKHAHVIAALDKQMVAKVANLPSASTTAANRYDTLKARLQRFQYTEHDRARSLLELRGLGDCKPSELMEKILALLQDESFHLSIVLTTN